LVADLRELAHVDQVRGADRRAQRIGILSDGQPDRLRE